MSTDSRLTQSSSAKTGADHEILQLWEIHRVVQEYYAPYDGMLVAAACCGSVDWIKALISIGANPNAIITNHLESPTLTAVKAILKYAPEETCLQCLKVRQGSCIFNIFSICIIPAQASHS